MIRISCWFQTFLWLGFHVAATIYIRATRRWADGMILLLLEKVPYTIQTIEILSLKKHLLKKISDFICTFNINRNSWKEARLRLCEPATLNQYVLPAALPTDCETSGLESRILRMCSTSGWGNRAGDDADRLQVRDITGIIPKTAGKPLTPTQGSLRKFAKTIVLIYRP